MANENEREYWNDTSGRLWVEHQALFDALLAPFVPILMGFVQPQSNVLEVGCGAGTLAVELGTTASSVTAIDISGPLLARAQEVADEAGVWSMSFVEADAQTDPIPDGPFDLVVSRFGVMFFDDPVAAFTNIRSVMRDGATLAFVSWQRPERQGWLHPPVTAAAAHVDLEAAGAGALPAPNTPGMFGLADEDHIRGILDASGFTEIALESVERPLLIGGPGGGVDGAVEHYTGAMRVRAIVESADEATVAAIVADLRAIVADHVDDAGDVRLDGAAWLVTARAG